VRKKSDLYRSNLEAADMSDEPHSRDAALARLIAEGLSRSKSGRNEQSSACPDAEVLAAYAEHILTEAEMARWEGHFADCTRCQRIIAVVAATDEFTDAGVERLSNLAAASSALPAVRRSAAGNPAAWWSSLWRKPVVWRWLVPVAGMASAAGLWFALHQAPRRETLTSHKIDATAEVPQNGVGAASARSDENQIAQSNLPAPAALAPPPEAQLQDTERPLAKSPATAKKEEAEKQEAVSNAVQAPPARAAGRPGETREYDVKDNRLPSAQPKSQVSDALSAASPQALAAAPPPPAPRRAFEGGAARQDLDRAAGAPAPARLKAFEQIVSPGIIFASPSRRVLWGVGSAGRIERSTDQGQSWQLQSSGVTADLLAGAAPSETVAWAVGRDGTILRTQDGEHWQRIAPPSETQTAASKTPLPDWISVEARDALHATITSRGFGRFATEDGGRTWIQLQ
jgi:hypothetical protein